MANTENTKEKKTMRKRARPLRGGSGAVTKKAREKQVRMREPARWEGPTNKLSSPHFWELELRLSLSGCRNLKPKQSTVCSSVTRRQVRKQGQVLQVLRRRTPKRGSPAQLYCMSPQTPTALNLLTGHEAFPQDPPCSLSGSFMLSTEGRNTSRCSFSSSGVLSTVSSNNFREMTSWLSKEKENKDYSSHPEKSVLVQASNPQLTNSDLKKNN